MKIFFIYTVFLAITCLTACTKTAKPSQPADISDAILKRITTNGSLAEEDFATFEKAKNYFPKDAPKGPNMTDSELYSYMLKDQVQMVNAEFRRIDQSSIIIKSHDETDGVSASTHLTYKRIGYHVTAEHYDKLQPYVITFVWGEFTPNDWGLIQVGMENDKNATAPASN